MTIPDPHDALRESQEFAEYREELTRWLDAHTADGGPLYRSGIRLCHAARSRGMSPERILVALHQSGLRPVWTSGSEADERARDRRYTEAVHLLMQSCFGERVPARVVRETGGREWAVFLVREGMKWDPEIEMRRADWLCCSAAGERRFIAPVPRGWEHWDDAHLLAAVARAKRDARG